MPPRVLRIATRSSQLALWQAESVARQLRAADADVKVSLLPLTTRGDQFLSAPISAIGGKGWFVKELEQALLSGAADLAVHSAKDMPSVRTSGLTLAAICERDDVTDCAGVAPGSCGHRFT